ncbi:hypothetical protein MASR2M117_12700 [Paludibacter sp.]
MKQFFDTYSDENFLSMLMKHIQNIDGTNHKFVSAVPTQITRKLDLQQRLLNNVLAKISWTNHLEILSGTKNIEDRIFYLMGCITEKWSMRELRRQIQTAVYERSTLAKKVVSPITNKIPENCFKDHIFLSF